MATLTLTVAEFRSAFPEFSNTTTYTSDLIELLINQSKCYIQTDNCRLSDDCAKFGWELMTAHLLDIKTRILSGENTTGQVASTSIDGISVSLVAPQNRDAWEYWLNSTPYGQQLLAFLLAKAPGGLYFGGSRQRVL